VDVFTRRKLNAFRRKFRRFEVIGKKFVGRWTEITSLSMESAVSPKETIYSQLTDDFICSQINPVFKGLDHDLSDFCTSMIRISNIR